MSRKTSSPYDVKLTEEQTADVTYFLCREVQAAQEARAALVADDGQIDYAHELYEQGSSKIYKNTPWPGAADLTSYIGTQMVDAARARAVKTILSEPICVVEGSGDS